MQDPYDSRYITALGKGVFVDFILIFLFTISYTIYNLIFKEIIVLPLEIIKSQTFLTYNFILLLCLIIYFIYKSKQLI